MKSESLSGPKGLEIPEWNASQWSVAAGTDGPGSGMFYAPTAETSRTYRQRQRFRKTASERVVMA